jgi:hypothetical protein
MTERQVNAILSRLKRARPGLLAYAEAAESSEHAKRWSGPIKEAKAIRQLLKDVELLVAEVRANGCTPSASERQHRLSIS